MSKRAHRSDPERRAAVERVLGGQRASAVARELGVHPATLYRWVHDASDGVAESAPTDARLMHATQALLRDHDYSQITVEEVARFSGVALRTAFHHFESKRDLFRAAIDDAATVLIDAMGQRYQGAQWPSEPLLQLSLFLRLSAEAIYATPSAHVLFRDLGVPRSDSFALRWHDTFEQAVAQLLATSARAEAIDPDTDIAAAAQAITGAMRGIHAAVFDGCDSAQALRIIARLHLTVLPG
ncbi:TetR family transcriptional regulator [Mycolicibacterium fluoranthenivorans]|uniref:Transcriptional regulator, TetR family n=1 Tax=Mycolicibacterium fluoranthenivorans TaxID=258505 RepID=A0A1G4VML9_9MYCO|nr:TetR family transcriptional regulator [Mycolicibacterium fluoranthenivorans]SCX09024.1 transcriptional regulator, TetR family [Mycolicibacterium fluoranthenivorans]